MIKILIIVSFIFSLANADFIRDDETGIVTDNETGLMWQDVNVKRHRWGNALFRCHNLNLGDYSDWRLPNYNELFSITDKSRESGSPTIKSAFKDVYYNKKDNDFYWTSTTFAINSDHAWVIYFYNSRNNEAEKSRVGFIRCVRGGG